MHDERCDGFEKDELRDATREIEEALAKNDIIVVYDKSGLHRSVSGARFTAESRATQGSRVTVISLGCAARDWAWKHEPVTFGVTEHTYP